MEEIKKAITICEALASIESIFYFQPQYTRYRHLLWYTLAKNKDKLNISQGDIARYFDVTRSAVSKTISDVEIQIRIYNEDKQFVYELQERL